MARHPAHHTNIRAAKAWAGNSYAHEGLIQPKRLCAVHLGSTVERKSRLNKNGAPVERPQTLMHFFTSSPPLFSTEAERERELAAGCQPTGGAAPPASPFTGVRRSPKGERAAIEPACGSALSQDPGAQP
jgi:hypothetical protein